MIARMRKYTFVLYHLDYEEFLTGLQKQGVLHIIRDKDASSEKMTLNRKLIEQYAECSKYLKKLLNDDSKAIQTPLLPKMLLNQINQARQKKDKLNRTQELLSRQLQDLKPWGHFDYEAVAKLKQEGVNACFYTSSKNHFKSAWAENYALEVVCELLGTIYFVVLSKNDEVPEIDADLFSFPPKSLKELEAELRDASEEMLSIEQFLAEHAKTASTLFEAEIGKLTGEFEFEDALQQADREADEHIAVLSGWIPLEDEPSLQKFLADKGVIHFSADPKEEDSVPVLLKNSWFASLYEPIAKLFMLPKYNDMDLTPFFAPFFMLFFGFCNADIGYGVILILFALFLKKKIKDPGIKAYMNLIMIFGIATSFMGWMMGSVFAYDIKNMAVIGGSVPIRETEQIFNFALVLGVIQILFGILLNAAKQMRQSGFRYGIASLGTFLFLLAAVIMGSTVMGADPGVLGVYAKYPMYLGLAMVFLFNSPGKNIIINILSGIWIMYNVLTGFFGDLLSYIRLFALGVSSAILGIVVNAMAAQFSAVPYIGPVIFLIFMVFGHTLNLALGALSGFVHPLRLTFVEFYKNAGFTGPGPEYKPFGRNNQ